MNEQLVWSSQVTAQSADVPSLQGNTGDRRSDYPLLVVSTGLSVLSSSQRGETEQFPCCLHSLNIHPSCSKRKMKKKERRRKQASHFLWHLKLGGKAEINGYFQGH